MPVIKPFKLPRLLNILLGLFQLCLTTVVPVCLHAQPKNDTLFINTVGEYPLYKHLYIYETDKTITPGFVYDSTKPTDFLRLYPNRGFNNTTGLTRYYWLVATFKNNLSHAETFYYWLNSPDIFTAVAYSKAGNGNIKPEAVSGYDEKWLTRQNTDDDVDFYFTLQAGEAVTMLLHIENAYGPEAFFLPQLSDAPTFKNYKLKYYITLSIIAGVMLAAFLLNIFFGIFLNEKIHYLYAVYIICILFEMFELEGITEDFIGSTFDSGAVTDMIVHVFPAVCAFLMARIMQWFLRQERSNSRIKILVDIINCILITVCAFYVFGLFLPYSLRFKEILLVVLCVALAIQILLATISAIEKIFQKYLPAWLYLAATLLVMEGLFEYVLIYLGVNDINLVRGTHPNHLQLGFVIETLVVFMGIVYRTSLHKKEKENLLVELNTQQLTLINKIVTAQETERRRIAEDLHDDAGATLNTLALHISNMREHIHTSESGQHYYKQSLALSNKAVNDIRSIAHNMLPKDFKAIELFTLMEQRIEELNEAGKIFFALVTDGNQKRLTDEVAITVYRITNELLNNITKHSFAKEATVQVLIEREKIQIIAEDNGLGFNIEMPAKGIGLKNISSRVEFLKGSIYIDSSDAGTSTIIDIPLA